MRPIRQVRLQFPNPAQPALSEYFSGRRHLGPATQQQRPNDDLIWHDGLVVVDV